MITNLTKFLRQFGISLVCCFALTANAGEEAEPAKIETTVLGMNVSGTKDLPNVLYIVPWKANSSAISPPEINRLVDEIYAPVDPEVFGKQVKFYYQLTAKPETPAQTETSDQ